MNNTLIEQLSRLKLEETALKRRLDKKLSSTERKNSFDRLKEVKKLQEKIKFKIQLERKMLDEEFR
jgi:hypothetical protein